MLSLLQFQIIVLLASLTVQIEPRIQLSQLCDKELTFLTNQQSITVQNSRDNPSNACKITFNGTLNTPVHIYTIQINLNSSTNVSSDVTSIRIVDHGMNMSLNIFILNETNISEIKNSILVESSCFEISFVDKNGEFNMLDSITITAESQAVATTKFLNNNSTINPNLDHLEEDKNGRLSNKMKYLIGFLVCMVLFSGAVFGLWTYRKRRLKWNQFLAQLDNNTDWEYEQLDDYHQSNNASGSVPTMSPIFDMTITKRENRVLESNDISLNDGLSERPSLVNNKNQSDIY